jgi:hypothetical protein
MSSRSGLGGFLPCLRPEEAVFKAFSTPFHRGYGDDFNGCAVYSGIQGFTPIWQNMGEIVPVIAKRHRILVLVQEFPPALFVCLPVSPGNLSTYFFLVFHV